MKELIAYIYDFLSIVFETLDTRKINEIILFGSVAKEEYDKNSDIDLFFNVEDRDAKEIEEELKKILKSFQVKSEKTWKLKKISFPINFIVGNLNNETWKNLKQEIISSGITLYSRYKESPEELFHNYLIYYSLSKFSRKIKMAFLRRVFGYRLKKGKKIYEQGGFLEKIKGLKIGSNVILVPAENIVDVKRLFRDFKVDYKIVESWIKS